MPCLITTLATTSPELVLHENSVNSSNSEEGSVAFKVNSLSTHVHRSIASMFLVNLTLRLAKYLISDVAMTAHPAQQFCSSLVIKSNNSFGSPAIRLPIGAELLLLKVKLLFFDAG